MFPYWLLFSVASLFALTETEQGQRQRLSITLLIGGVFIALMIGLRYEVGGDWGPYLRYFRSIRYLSLVEVLSLEDPGYYLLNWLGYNLGLTIVAVNLVCGIIFVCGLVSFARTLPQPWLAIVVAVPYLVIVVAMGYTRQGVAIGLVMLALSAFRAGASVKAVFWIVLAVTFHKTAIITLPLLALAKARRKLQAFTVVAFIMVILYYQFLESSVDDLYSNYIEREEQSQGAFIRVLMNIVPSGVFLLAQKRFELSEEQMKLWRNLSLAAIACLPALYFVPSTTVIDRLALYLIPLQLFVLAWLPTVLGSARKLNGVVFSCVLLYSALIQFVWLNYAANADDWLPYQLIP